MVDLSILQAVVYLCGLCSTINGNPFHQGSGSGAWEYEGSGSGDQEYGDSESGGREYGIDDDKIRSDHNVMEFMSPPKPNNVDPGTTGPPQRIESNSINHKPFIANRIDQIALTAGKASRIVIPANTFQDLEDGDTRNLSLKVVLFGYGSPIDELEWIKFYPEIQEIIALPMHIGEYEFQVIATDKGGMFEREMLQIVVRQHSSIRNIHHSFNLSLTMANPNNFNHDIDWEMALLFDISGYFNDADPSSITVLSKRRWGSEVQFVWTNDSLPLETCPLSSIESIYGRMIDEMSGDVAPSFKEAMKRDFDVKKVSLKMKGLCGTGGSTGINTGYAVPKLPHADPASTSKISGVTP